MPDAEARPRAMRDATVREQRRAMLDLPHIVPLAAYAAELRLRGGAEVPDFDPLDGGTEARALFLFEKPGPMTSANGGGSGFISRDNDDPTAEATFTFMRQAEVPRKLAALWNVVPWWNGTRKVCGQELRDGVNCVRDLIERLPRLRAVVLVGGAAARAKPLLGSAGFALLSSDHPSPLVRARWPERWRAIPVEWSRVNSFLA